MNAYPREDLVLEIHAVRYYCTVPHAPRKLLPSWVILHGPIVMLTPAPVEYKRRQEADQRTPWNPVRALPGTPSAHGHLRSHSCVPSVRSAAHAAATVAAAVQKQRGSLS